jgi:hypothetical protein
MSFNFKQKVILKYVNPDKVFIDYKNSLNKIEDIKCCDFCGCNNRELKFGIPISVKLEDNAYIFEVCGIYCSLTCAYQEYIQFSKKVTVKQNVKFTDSEPCFRLLSHLLFGNSDIPNNPEKTSIFNKENISFVFKKETF